MHRTLFLSFTVHEYRAQHMLSNTKTLAYKPKIWVICVGNDLFSRYEKFIRIYGWKICMRRCPLVCRYFFILFFFSFIFLLVPYFLYTILYFRHIGYFLWCMAFSHWHANKYIIKLKGKTIANYHSGCTKSPTQWVRCTFNRYQFVRIFMILVVSLLFLF